METPIISILSFELFEKKAQEARFLLYTTYIEIKNFKEANSVYREMDSVNFYAWQTNQERLIYAKSYNCKRYLEYFTLGDFVYCEQIIEKGWYEKPSLLVEDIEYKK